MALQLRSSGRFSPLWLDWLHIGCCQGGGISSSTVDGWRAKDARFAQFCASALGQASFHIELLHLGAGGMASNPKRYGRLGAADRKRIEEKMRPDIKARVRAEIEVEARRPEEVFPEMKRRLDEIKARREAAGES
jgi:hypothetical protein